VYLRNVGNYLPVLKAKQQVAPKLRWLFTETDMEAGDFTETFINDRTEATMEATDCSKM
jgi:hypothetical protein